MKRSKVMSEGPRPHKGVAAYLRFYILATLLLSFIALMTTSYSGGEVPKEIMDAANGSSVASEVVASWVAVDLYASPRVWELWLSGVSTAILAYIALKGFGKISSALKEAGRKGLGRVPVAVSGMHAAAAAILLWGSAYLSSAVGDIVSRAAESIGSESVAGADALREAYYSAIIVVIKSPETVLVSLGEAAAAGLVLSSLIIAYWVLSKGVSVRLSNVVLFALSLELITRLGERLYVAAAPIPAPIAPQTLSLAVFVTFLFRVIVQYSHTYRLDEWFAGLSTGSGGEGVPGRSPKE